MRKRERECVVCKQKIEADEYGNGECLNCGWFNNVLGEEMENDVVFPNLVSLKRAKECFTKNEKIKPTLGEFLEALYLYGEMCFDYEGKEFSLFLIKDKDKNEIIEFVWSPTNCYYFKYKKEFTDNAKIESDKVKDIWNRTYNARYM